MSLAVSLANLEEFLIRSGKRSGAMMYSPNTFVQFLSTTTSFGISGNQDVEYSYPGYGANPIYLQRKTVKTSVSFSIWDGEYSQLILKAKAFYTSLEFNSILDFPFGVKIIYAGVNDLYIPNRVEVYEGCLFKSYSRDMDYSTSNAVVRISFECLKMTKVL